MATDAEIDELLKEKPLELVIDSSSGEKRNFGNAAEFREFVERERAFWVALNWDKQPMTATLADASTATRKAVNLSSQDAVREFRQAAKSLNANRDHIVYSSSPRGKFIAGLYKENKASAEGAYDYFRNQIEHRPQKFYFEGVIRAFQFEHPPAVPSHLIQAERAAFSELRQEISVVRDQYKAAFSGFMEEAQKWRASSDESFRKVLADQEANLKSTNTFWHSKLESTHSERVSKFDELEKLYEEKLRLASPAEHWEKLETRYLKSGRIGTGLLVALVAATAVVVGRLLYYPPAAWTQEALTPAVVKGAVILTVGISVTVYLMHMGVRHVTSSYHLARDARERLQLTHMFLALLRDKAIEPKEREIVLSALFSRSDTGLLRHDSTPTLPSPFGSLLDAIKGGK